MVFILIENLLYLFSNTTNKMPPNAKSEADAKPEEEPAPASASEPSAGLESVDQKLAEETHHSTFREQRQQEQQEQAEKVAEAASQRIAQVELTTPGSTTEAQGK